MPSTYSIFKVFCNSLQTFNGCQFLFFCTILNNLNEVEEKIFGDLKIYSGLWINSNQQRIFITTAWSGWGKTSAARATTRICSSIYKNKIVKVIVRKKSNIKEFEKFIDKLYASGVQDLKIIENFEIQESEEFDINEDENTLSILNRYIEESEFDLDKNIIKNIFQDLYREACEVE